MHHGTNVPLTRSLQLVDLSSRIQQNSLRRKVVIVCCPLRWVPPMTQTYQCKVDRFADWEVVPGRQNPDLS